jgi:hypothetical protein
MGITAQTTAGGQLGWNNKTIGPTTSLLNTKEIGCLLGYWIEN